MVTWHRPLDEINFLGLEFPRHICITRLSTSGTPYTVFRGIGVPKIPEEYINTVFYLYESKEDAKKGTKAGGTGFLVSVPSPSFPEQVIYTYAVTNWHNCCKAKASVIRLNNEDGSAEIFDFGPEDWTFSPKYDIAALRIPVDDRKSGVLIPMEMAIIPEDIRGERLALGVGDNIFMLGRFIDHDGTLVNRPAARFGNISVMPAPMFQPNLKKADSFCLDMHSRTGFSGSPVFVYRSIGDDLDEKARTTLSSQDTFLKFLGIHWGQFPELWEWGHGKEAEANSLSARRRYVKGVSGMTCVLPAWNIQEVLGLPKFREQLERDENLLIEHAREHGLPATAEDRKISVNWIP
jgi:hypothetical protein